MHSPSARVLLPSPFSLPLPPLPLQASLQVAMRLEEDITDVQGQVAVRAQAEQARSKVGVRMRPTLLCLAAALPLSLDAACAAS